MQNAGRYPWYTAITIRGAAADLAAFKAGWCVVDDDRIEFTPEARLPPPQVLAESAVTVETGLEAMVLIGIADRIELPPDCPPEPRAAKMLVWLSGPGRSHRQISPDRWLTLRDIAGAPAEASEETIAKAWLTLHPEARDEGAARLQRIRRTGYAALDLWLADHYGATGLTVEILEERQEQDQPCLVFSIVSALGAPDLLMKQVARANPALTFELIVAQDPDTIFLVTLRGNEDDRRRVETPEERGKALHRLGFELAGELVEIIPGHVAMVLPAPAAA